MGPEDRETGTSDSSKRGKPIESGVGENLRRSIFPKRYGIEKELDIMRPLKHENE